MNDITQCHHHDRVCWYNIWWCQHSLPVWVGCCAEAAGPLFTASTKPSNRWC
jgi:hypothetical protein